VLLFPCSRWQIMINLNNEIKMWSGMLNQEKESAREHEKNNTGLARDTYWCSEEKALERYDKLISIGEILLFYAVYSLFEALGGTWLSLMGGNWETQPFMSDTLACILMLLFYGGIFYASSRKDKHKEAILKPTIKIGAAATIISIGIGGGFSYYWLLFVEAALQDIPFIKESTERFLSTGDAVENEPYLWVFCSVVFLGPIVEELLFRGLIFKQAEKIKNGLFPTILSAILFGIFHMEFVQSVYTLIMGLALGFIYQMTRSLVLVCYLHILNNFFAAPPPILETDLFFSLSTNLQIVMILPAVYLLYRWIKRYRIETNRFIEIENADEY
ncbi:MAG: CPBP family intramembrane glutamic endopeptidase, partial [Oscillospiraceae bacterium]